jgi:hypothetical protein
MFGYAGRNGPAVAGHVVLNVRKGQTTFSTSVLLKSASDSDLLAAEKTLALLILGRI